MSDMLLNYLLMIKSLVTMCKPPDKEIFSNTHLVKTEHSSSSNQNGAGLTQE